MRKTTVVRTAAFALLATLAALAAADQANPAPPPSNPAFDRMKALAGEWVAAEDGPMAKKGELAARYVLTAGGSALVETIFPGSPHETVTVYTADGQDVVLTHYCVLGNQPHMRAKAPTGARFDFAFDGNVQADGSAHMHSAWVELVGRDELRSEWTEHDGGRPAMVVGMHLLRREG
jgi:hypothetical protein